MTLSIAMAAENGYQNIEDCIREGVTLKAGDKVYAQYMKKDAGTFPHRNKTADRGNEHSRCTCGFTETRCKNRIHYMKIHRWHIWTHTTMAV